jgi:hypothetical protein
MPASEGLWLYNDQGLAPVKPATEPDQGHAGGMGGALRCDVAFLIQRQLFAQKEVFSCEGRCRSETLHEKAPGIYDEREQHGCLLTEMLKSA